MLTKTKVKKFFEEKFNEGYKKHLEDTKREPKISPSGLMTCYRKHYWKAIGEEESNPTTFNTAAPLIFGTNIHKLFEDIMLKASVDNCNIERKVTLNGVSGTADLLVKIDGEYALVDYKSMSDAKYFRTIKNEDIGDMYISQATFYAKALEKELGTPIKYIIFVLINRNMYDMMYEPIVFKINKDNMKKVNKYIDKLKEFINNKTLPEGKPFEFWECYFFRNNKTTKKKEKIICCPYYDKCQSLGGK